MRIEGTNRSSGVAARAGVKRNASSGFSVDESAETPRAASTEGVYQAANIDALLALQSIEDPLFAKKKALRRGNALLDTLETIKADLLLGQVSEGRLNQLMALVTQARERQDPEIDALLNDIELRARVELAKFGRYPA